MEEMKTITQKVIGGVKLNTTGIKGVDIIYSTIEIIDGVSYSSDDVKKSWRPAHKDLKEFVKDLKPYLIELCGYSSDSILEGDFEVTGIKAGKESFIISGKLRSWGDKVIAINTPLIKEVDAYDKYDEVMTLVDKIYTETDLYLKGIKKSTRKEIIVDYVKDVKKNNLFTFEYFTEMTPEEQEELMKEIEKDMGISVHEEDGKVVIGASEEPPLVSGSVESKEEIKEVVTDDDFSLNLDDVL